MSNLKDNLKDRIRKTSAHDQLIDTIDTNVDGNVDVAVNKNVYVRAKRKKFEEQHTRQTYYIENELLVLLHRVAGNEKGEKTRIVNEALRAFLEGGK